MSKEFSFANKGTCSKQTNFVLNDDHTIASIEVIGGCNGNLKGICQLVTGMKAEDVIARLDGTLCGFRNTSCPDQIAQNLKKALEELTGNRSKRGHRALQQCRARCLFLCTGKAKNAQYAIK